MSQNDRNLAAVRTSGACVNGCLAHLQCKDKSLQRRRKESAGYPSVLASHQCTRKCPGLDPAPRWMQNMKLKVHPPGNVYQYLQPLGHSPRKTEPGSPDIPFLETALSEHASGRIGLYFRFTMSGRSSFFPAPTPVASPSPRHDTTISSLCAQ